MIMLTDISITAERLSNQGLTKPLFKKPEDVVKSLGAVQAQDYQGAKWALHLRLHNSSDETLEKALNDGKILRTHVMRPTWHFVTPQDIRWMLELTSPRVNMFNAYYYRRAGFDERIFTKSKPIIEKALQGNNYLTRIELQKILAKTGFTNKDNLLSHLLGHAELNGFICSGPRKGKHFTYALFQERVPKTKVLTREQALAEIVRRYFTSHGPAQLKDFSWWSGLTITDAKKGIAMVREVKNVEIQGKTYYFTKLNNTEIPSEVYLIPNYDEYYISYKDRAQYFDIMPKQTLGNALFSHAIVSQGKIVGMWRRTIGKKEAILETKMFRHSKKLDQREFNKAIDRYSQFLGMPVRVKH